MLITIISKATNFAWEVHGSDGLGFDNASFAVYRFVTSGFVALALYSSQVSKYLWLRIKCTFPRRINVTLQ